MTRTRVDWRALLACGMCYALLAGCGGDRIRYGIHRERGGDGAYDAYGGRTAEGPQLIRFGGVVTMWTRDYEGRFLAAAARIDEQNGREVYNIVVIDTEAEKEVGRWSVQRRYALIDGAVIETLKEESDIGTLRGLSVTEDGRLVSLIYSLGNGEYADIEIALWDTATHRRVRRLRFELSEARKEVLRRYGHKYLMRAGTTFSTDREYITARVTWTRDTKFLNWRKSWPGPEDRTSVVVTYPLSDE